MSGEAITFKDSATITSSIPAKSSAFDGYFGHNLIVHAKVLEEPFIEGKIR
jgi:hypothetical protein